LVKNLLTALQNHPGFARVILSVKPYKRLDFSEANTDLITRDLSETEVFSDYVFDEMLQNRTYTGIGGYAENRVIYRQRKHFTIEETEPRSVHLGTDIWAAAGESVFAPIEGEVHSFAFNDNYGDYGPTIILKHKLNNIEFFTLYGHLSLASLKDLYEGKQVEKAEKFAAIGNFPENGDWPPHLHFQVISDMGGLKGDFPGVSSLKDQAHYLNLCPDPNMILRIRENEC
jgi:murein DD-endopeptidase MepM/ murein hydrolase activator NlpD